MWQVGEFEPDSFEIYSSDRVQGLWDAFERTEGLTPFMRGGLLSEWCHQGGRENPGSNYGLPHITGTMYLETGEHQVTNCIFCGIECLPEEYRNLAGSQINDVRTRDSRLLGVHAVDGTWDLEGE